MGKRSMFGIYDGAVAALALTPVRALSALLAASIFRSAAASTPAGAALLKGVSYGPVPLKSVEGVSQLPEDDWFCNEAVPMWGAAGRADLRNIRKLGANFVRLYGNDPNNDHTNFLDAAWAENLSVAAGMSDYPYFQMQSRRNCQATDFNCFSQVKELYLLNLENGFLTPEGRYHPALRYMNILNEPDLKMPPGGTNGGAEGPALMARALISAFDAMLDAEKEFDITGPLINITATFSYAICGACERFSSRPALGQMATLDDAMRNPGKYGYTPKNDIMAAYLARFTHSFNTQNPASDLRPQFLEEYVAAFPGTPVYIGEYHRVPVNQTVDLAMVLSIAEAEPLFLGISFFQYQVAYWKQGPEREFGMFALAEGIVQEMPYVADTSFDVFCLEPVQHAPSGMSLPDAVAMAYGGEPVNAAVLCEPNPLGVNLTQEGLDQVVAQGSLPQAELFVERMIRHVGGSVKANGWPALRGVTRALLETRRTESFSHLAAMMGSKPGWIDFDEKAKCVANRAVHPEVIVEAIGWTCQSAETFSCDDIPVHCNSTYRIGDYVFSRFFEELGPTASPLEDCSFGGAALFAPSPVYEAWTGAGYCVSGGAELPTVAPPAEAAALMVAAREEAPRISRPSMSAAEAPKMPIFLSGAPRLAGPVLGVLALAAAAVSSAAARPAP